MPIEAKLELDNNNGIVTCKVFKSPNGNIVNYMWSVISSKGDEKYLSYIGDNKYNFTKFRNKGLEAKCIVTDEAGSEVICKITI